MSDIPESVKALPFKDVRYIVQDRLAVKLDPEGVTNWRHLACEAGELDSDTIATIETLRLGGKKPTMEVFRRWGHSHPNATLAEFIKICQKLGRNDVIMVISQAYKAGELFQFQRDCFRGGEENSCTFSSYPSANGVSVATPDVSVSISVHPSMEPNVLISGGPPSQDYHQSMGSHHPSMLISRGPPPQDYHQRIGNVSPPSNAQMSEAAPRNVPVVSSTSMGSHHSQQLQNPVVPTHTTSQHPQQTQNERLPNYVHNNAGSPNRSQNQEYVEMRNITPRVVTSHQNRSTDADIHRVYKEPVYSQTSQNPVYMQTSHNPVYTQSSHNPVHTHTSSNPVHTQLSQNPVHTHTSQNPVHTHTSPNPVYTHTSQNPVHTHTSQTPVYTQTSQMPVHQAMQSRQCTPQTPTYSSLSNCDAPRTLLSVEPPNHGYSSRCTGSCNCNDRQEPVCSPKPEDLSSCCSHHPADVDNGQESSPSVGPCVSVSKSQTENVQRREEHPKILMRSISDSVCSADSIAESDASQRNSWPRDKSPPQSVNGQWSGDMLPGQYRNPVPQGRYPHGSREPAPPTRHRHRNGMNHSTVRGEGTTHSPVRGERRHQHRPQPLNMIQNTARAVPKVFLTYGSDQANSKIGVRNVLENLTKNGFEVTLDMKRREFPKVTEDRVGWLNHQFQSCDFILVCCSPAYDREAKMEAENVPTNVNDHSLNTRYIASLMNTEYREKGSRNYRFIPVVMPNDGNKRYADTCVPLWLRNTIIYHWPQDFQSLMGRLTHSERTPPPPQRVGPGPKIVQMIH